MKTFMLLLAFTLTEPNGFQRDEIVNVLSRHFDTKTECVEFVQDWEGTIRSRGLEAVQGMLKDDWTVELVHVGCTEKPILEVISKNDEGDAPFERDEGGE
jgi:hypothetical protein|tara:strand:- start:1977 stop:2276 length:300 start_codon:yes stop_codon:yes gene_type:complete